MTSDPLEAVRETLRDGDELIEITSFSSAGPELLIGRSAVDTATAQLRALYLADRITIEQFEHGLDEIMATA